MTTTNNTATIENFLSGLITDIDILNLINLEDINFSDPYNSIYEMIDRNNGFDMEVIYYASAMEYLMENDNSLRKSLEIAHELGYTADKINSELLASLLKSQNERKNFTELEEQEEENED